jgi:hypothetical protein
MHTSL